MPAPHEITVTQLLRLIGLPDCPVIVDVCTPEDHAEDPYLIPGSIRHSHERLPDLLEHLQNRSAVILCQRGLKLSQGTAALLRAEGVRAEYLSGGMMAWRQAGAPRLPAAKVPGNLWVTRHRPKIDRIACPWLIKRFVDKDARFLFVAPSEVANVAEKFGATPFDTDTADWGHRNQGCTFDMMLDVWGLRTEALDRLSTLVRGADTNRHDLHPAAAGLLAISVGLSRQFRDDQAHLRAGLPLYDALYRWARDGHEEEHTHGGR